MRRLSGFLMVAALLAALMPSAVLAGKPAASMDSTACTSTVGGVPVIKVMVSWENFHTYEIRVLAGTSNPIVEGTWLFAVEPWRTNPYMLPMSASSFSPYTYMQAFVVNRKGGGPGGSVMEISTLPTCG